jgi:hypothetical protein
MLARRGTEDPASKTSPGSWMTEPCYYWQPRAFPAGVVYWKIRQSIILIESELENLGTFESEQRHHLYGEFLLH